MLTPRPYQQKGHDELFNLIDSGEQRICVTAPTGAGKTKSLSMAIEEAVSRGWRVSLYTHRSVLIPQISGVLSSQGIDHGIRASGFDPDLNRDVQVSMFQTEDARCMRKNPRWNLHGAKLVLIDEAHGYTAGITQRIIDHHVSQGAAVAGFTATPVDLWHMYNKLVVVTNNSELRKCGAHVPCLEFAPDEPDMNGLRRTKVGEYVEGDVVKKIMVPTVFGRVWNHYKILNPFRQPALLFGPSVDGSRYFCDEFNGKGVPSAHIDAKQIYYGHDEKSGSPIVESSNQRNRQILFDRVKEGEIKLVCNRFVLTEGLDLPELYLGILCSMYWSVKMFLQAAGRLLRSHESLDHVCVARGTLILTDRGEIPVEDVTVEDKIWDGLDFVSHDGPILVGHKGVISWDGVTATPDHKVLTGSGWMEIQDAKKRNERIVESGACGTPVRVPDDSNPYDTQHQCQARRDGQVFEMQSDSLGQVLQDKKEGCSRLPVLHETLWGPLSGMDLSESAASVEAVQRSKGSLLSSLWRQRDSVQIQGRLRSHLLDCVQSRSTGKQRPTARPKGQQRPLRAGEPSLGNTEREYAEPREVCTEELSISHVSGRVSSCKIRPDVPGHTVPCGTHCTGNSREVGCIHQVIPLQDDSIQEVWDIRNCGPRNRFTANGKVVANCLQDHGGNVWQHGSVNDDRTWEIGDTSKQIRQERVERMEKGEEELCGITCPKCHFIRLSGPKCHQCGHAHVRSSRMVVQVDGTLKKQVGPQIKKKKQKPEGIKAWNDMYWPASKSKNPHSMTWKQMWALFKRKNPEYMPYVGTDQHGRDRLTIIDPKTKIPQPLPFHPPLGDTFLWSLKVRDVPMKDLLK